jgi:hypothetical protein
MFWLPPPSSNSSKKKATLWCFAHDYPGAEIAEITKAALGRLEEDEDGKTVKYKNVNGDMKLFTKSSWTAKLHAFDVNKFFNEFNIATSKMDTGQQQPVDMSSIQPFQALPISLTPDCTSPSCSKSQPAITGKYSHVFESVPSSVVMT